MKTLIGVFALMLLMGSCDAGPPQLLEREELFRLNLGTLEDEMDLFVRDGQPNIYKNRLVFFEGLVFISNGQSGKLMEFSSYGDLLTMLYHPQKNPQPVVLGISGQDSQVRNRLAIPYEFLQIGEVAVYGNKNLLVEDQIRPERQSFDEKLGAQLEKVVLRFDSTGQYLDYLGQDGLGGKPFPYIERLSSTNSQEITVVSRTPKQTVVYWFSEEGKRLYTQGFSGEELSLPSGKLPGEVYPFIDAVVPDTSTPLVHLQVTYFERHLDPITKTSAGIGVLDTRLMTYDLRQNRFTGNIAIPRLEIASRSGLPEGLTQDLPYEFLGVADGQKFFFLSSSDQGDHRLLILDSQGHPVSEKRIFIPDSEVYTADFHVSPRGVLSAMLSDGTDVKVVIWRTDRLLSIL